MNDHVSSANSSPGRGMGPAPLNLFLSIITCLGQIVLRTLDLPSHPENKVRTTYFLSWSWIVKLEIVIPCWVGRFISNSPKKKVSGFKFYYVTYARVIELLYGLDTDFPPFILSSFLAHMKLFHGMEAAKIYLYRARKGQGKNSYNLHLTAFGYLHLTAFAIT